MSPVKRVICILSGLLLLAGAGWAQEPKPSEPAPPAPAPASPQVPLYDTVSQQQVDVSKLTPDDRPLTGAQSLTLGVFEGAPNYLIPSLHFGQSFDSNPAVRAGSDPGYQGVSVISGGLKLQRRSRKSELLLKYEGGGTFYTGDNQNFGLARRDYTYHQMGISQSVSVGRWSVLLADEVSYSPESVLGYGGAGYGGGGFSSLFSSLSGVGGNSLIGLNSGLLPNQSILTQHTSRVGNSVVGQLQYNLSRRTAVTFSGSYGILRFPDGTLLDNNQILASAGFNRILSARDSIGIQYSYSLFQYETGNNLEAHAANLVYARRMTGRLSLRLSAGGQIYRFSLLPQLGTKPSWNAGAGLQYRMGRTDLSLNYYHSLTSGSGIFFGSRSDVVTAGLGRSLSRNWSTAFSFGYSHNSGLQNALYPANGRAYDSVYGGVTVHRNIGRYTGIFFSYNAQQQTGVVPCPGCGNELLRHVFGFGFDWTHRPIRLD